MGRVVDKRNEIRNVYEADPIAGLVEHKLHAVGVNIDSLGGVLLLACIMECEKYCRLNYDRDKFPSAYPYGLSSTVLDIVCEKHALNKKALSFNMHHALNSRLRREYTDLDLYVVMDHTISNVSEVTIGRLIYSLAKMAMQWRIYK